MCDAREERVKEELSCRQPFDKAHGGTAAGTWPRHSWCGGGGRVGRGRWGAGKRLATLRQPAGAPPRREEAAIADADEALREDVQEEATEKFVDVERQRPHLASVAVVLPPKRHGVVGHREEPVGGEGDTVGVPREIVQYVGGAAKGRLGVDHPRLAIEGSEEGSEGDVGREWGAAPWKRQAALPIGFPSAGDEFAAINRAQHWDRPVAARAAL